MMQPKHPFHLVDPSPWPFLASMCALMLTFSSVFYFHGHLYGIHIVIASVCMLLYVFYVWYRDVIREASFHGDHTRRVQVGLQYGIILFILSEVCFFVAFFWAYFHVSLTPTIALGGVWPPTGLTVVNPWMLPFLNTLILLSSGACVTYAHHLLCSTPNQSQINIAFAFTIILAFVFTGLQVCEYMDAPFALSDGVYGSTFYMATGFHGFHVILGTIFLIVCALRTHHFSKIHHVGFEAAAWYWHFVEVVWLFLFVCIYWWGAH
jgi:heme/copper-type cytochrome/quinol oxidase subunit 3